MLAAAPALANVRALCLLAHGGQFQFAQLFLDLVEIGANRNFRLQPRRQTKSFIFALFPAQLALVLLPLVGRRLGILHELLETGTAGQTIADGVQRFAARLRRGSGASRAVLVADDYL